MLIKDAQKEMRAAFLGGFAGQLIAGAIWALSAALGTLNPQYGIAFLFFASMLLFPLTQFMLRVMGRPPHLSAENSLGQLATQIAFTVPINFVLVFAATLYRQNWFYPASMIVVGAHYVPFVFLYGMRQFGALAAVLILGGVGIGLYASGVFSLGGWLAAVAFLMFVFAGRAVVMREEKQSHEGSDI